MKRGEASIGDRIRVIRDVFPYISEGSEGEIVEISLNLGWPVIVEFDNGYFEHLKWDEIELAPDGLERILEKLPDAL